MMTMEVEVRANLRSQLSTRSLLIVLSLYCCQSRELQQQNDDQRFQRHKTIVYSTAEVFSACNLEILFRYTFS